MFTNHQLLLAFVPCALDMDTTSGSAPCPRPNPDKMLGKEQAAFHAQGMARILVAGSGACRLGPGPVEGQTAPLRPGRHDRGGLAGVVRDRAAPIVSAYQETELRY